MAIESVRDIVKAGNSAFTQPGAVSITRVAATVSPAVYNQAFVTVADAGVTASSKIMCQLEPSADWDADDLTDAELLATAADGSIEFCIAMPGPIVGDFDFLYMVG